MKYFILIMLIAGTVRSWWLTGDLFGSHFSEMKRVPTVLLVIHFVESLLFVWAVGGWSWKLLLEMI